MEVCKSCDHNVIIECSGGCFFPHNTPPCFRQAMESQTTVVQQLKAEILRYADEGIELCFGSGCDERIAARFEKIIAKLSAV